MASILKSIEERAGSDGDESEAESRESMGERDKRGNKREAVTSLDVAGMWTIWNNYLPIERRSLQFSTPLHRMQCCHFGRARNYKRGLCVFCDNPCPAKDLLMQGLIPS